MMRDLEFQEQLAELEVRNPLPEVAESYGVTLRRSGKSFIARCPFHDDRNPSLQIFLGHDGRWGFKCYAASCGASGGLFHFIGRLEFGQTYTNRGAQFKRVIEVLGASDFHANPTHRPMPKALPERPPITPRIQFVWDAAMMVCAELLQAESAVKAYLESRKINTQMQRSWRFGWWPKPAAGRHSPVITTLTAVGFSLAELREARLLRPSTYATGDYEFFGGRILTADIDLSHQPAYLIGRRMPGDSSHAKYLGLADFAKPVLGKVRISRSQAPLFLLEGFWNMMFLHAWGYDAVAVSGAQLSDRQTTVLQALAAKRPLIPIRDLDAPDIQGQSPGLIALRSWQAALPGLPEGIELPPVVDGYTIKDVADLAQHPQGKAIFRDLAARWAAVPHP